MMAQDFNVCAFSKKSPELLKYLYTQVWNFMNCPKGREKGPFFVMITRLQNRGDRSAREEKQKINNISA